MLGSQGSFFFNMGTFFELWLVRTTIFFVSFKKVLLCENSRIAIRTVKINIHTYNRKLHASNMKVLMDFYVEVLYLKPV